MSAKKKTTATAKAKSGADGATSSSQAVTALLKDIKAWLEDMKPLSGLTVHSRSPQLLIIINCLQVKDATRWARDKKICIPWDAFLPKKESGAQEDLCLGTAPPANIAIVGSFLLETMVGAPAVDLAVEMPATLLERQDDANDYRYSLKRAFYLATVAQVLSGLPALQGSGAVWTWTPFRGHISRPVLTIALAEPQVKINIHIVLPRMHFVFGRLAPGKNMVRASAALDILSGEKGLRSGTLVEAPTPIYNSLVLLDMLMVEHLKLIHAQCKSLPALREAIKLAKAWLQQWAPPNQAFGFSGFHLSILAVYLARLGRLDPLMSELQLFKIILHFLAEQEWQRPILFPGWTPSEGTLSVYQENFAAALVEPVAGMNILFDLSAEGVREVSRQARIALQILARDDYQCLFTQPQPRLAHFDSYFVVKQMLWLPDIQANLGHYQSQIVPENARLKMLARKLQQALGTRVKTIMISPIMTTAAPVKEEGGRRSSLCPAHCITEYAIGLVWNGAEAQRLVELGPIASEDDTETRQFRQFWRGRSELRRFPDGSVREAVAWESFATKRYAIIPDIVSFIMETHFGTEHVESADLGVAFAWQSTRLLYGDLPDVLLRFSRAMKSISDLPLAVTRCEPISPAACLTQVLRLPTVGEVEQHGNGGGVGEFVPVTEMLVYLEGSSRWPEEYYGFQYAKQAFSVQICQALQARFGLETSLTETYFDVCMDGYVLRCHMHQEGELPLWHRQGLDSSEYLLLHEERPRHCRVIAALSQGSLAYGVACRLFKRWFSAQMYSLQLPEPLLELLMAANFLSGQQPPQSALSGFVRALELLARHPWAEQPLLVDFEQRGGEEASGNVTWSAETALAVFEAASSKSDNRPTLWVAPSYQVDGDCCIWSRQATLTPQDLVNLQGSAQQALDAINALNPAWEELLTPDYGRFSLMARIDLGDLHRQPKAAKLISSHAHQRFMRALPGFDPIAALLKRLGHYCERKGLIVYYDLLNRGPMIGLVAKEGLLDGRQRQTVAEEIRELAGGLLSKVAVPQELLSTSDRIWK